MVGVTGATAGPPDPKPVGMREFTTAEIADLVQVQQAAFLRDGPPSLALRRNRMDRLSALVFENAAAFAATLCADFGTRSRQTTAFFDVAGTLSDFVYSRRNLRRWMKPRTVLGIAGPLGLHTTVEAHPLGVVGIVAPWNTPLNLSVMPATAALAAGNRVLIKAPEATPRTSELLARLAGQYFSPDELFVITGGPAAGAAFCAMDFDHLFFTGSTRIAKHVQRSAAEHLVPVTFELGGKNPVVVGRDADIAEAASRIARARLLNGGQVCLCPDYVFVPADRCDQFVAAAERQFRASFPTITGNPHFCSIIDDKNYQRVVSLIEDARAKGANVIEAKPAGEELPSAAERKITPTILTGVTPEMEVMTEEVFGPVLSVLPYENLDEVIDYINARPSPLAAYWMGKDSDDFRRYCARTRSGGVTRNDLLLHAAIAGAPFGGVGDSGMGAYHGKAGFDTFSHYRTVTESSLRGTVASLTVPPIPARATALVDWVVAKQAKRLRKRIDRYESARNAERTGGIRRSDPTDRVCDHALPSFVSPVSLPYTNPEEVVDMVDFEPIGTGLTVFEHDKTVEGPVVWLDSPSAVMEFCSSGDVTNSIVLARGGTTTFLTPALSAGVKGVMTLQGSPECHLGILSREYGIPTLMSVAFTEGVRSVRGETIPPDGAIVRLDATTAPEGSVHIAAGDRRYGDDAGDGRTAEPNPEAATEAEQLKAMMTTYRGEIFDGVRGDRQMRVRLRTGVLDNSDAGVRRGLSREEISDFRAYAGWNLWDMIRSRQSEGESGLIPRQEYETVGFVQQWSTYARWMDKITDKIGADGIIELGAVPRREIGTKANHLHAWATGITPLNGGAVCDQLGVASEIDRQRNAETVIQFQRKLQFGLWGDGPGFVAGRKYQARVLEDRWIDRFRDEETRLDDPDRLAAFRKFNATTELTGFLLHYDNRAGLCDTGPYPLPDGGFVLVRDHFLYEQAYEWSEPMSGLPYAVTEAMFFRPDTPVEIAINDIATTFAMPKNYLKHLSGAVVYARDRWDTPVEQVRRLNDAEMAGIVERCNNAMLELYASISELSWTKGSGGACGCTPGIVCCPSPAPPGCGTPSCPKASTPTAPKPSRPTRCWPAARPRRRWLRCS